MDMDMDMESTVGVVGLFSDEEARDVCLYVCVRERARVCMYV